MANVTRNVIRGKSKFENCSNNGGIITRESGNSGNGEPYFIREFKFDKTAIKIYQESVGDVGCVVWDSSIVACHYFIRQPSFWKGKKILELGAGTGLCSILLATLGAHVVATDLPDQISLLEKNIWENLKTVSGTGGSVRAEAFDWNDPSDKPLRFDVIVIVDAIYYLKALEGLIRTLLRSETTTMIFCCYEVRDIGEPEIAQKRFFKMITPFLDVYPVADEELDPVYRSPDIKVLRLVRK